MTTTLGMSWSWATLSKDGVYRYALGRRLKAEKENDDPGVLFIMLNPSTADHTHNDPTIKRLISFADKWGYRTLTVCNLFAFRTAYPEVLIVSKQSMDVVGPENDKTILGYAEDSDLIVCAWGNSGTIAGRDKEVVEMLTSKGLKLCHLGLTKTGQPRHPLYLPGGQTPEPWRRAEV